MFAVKIERSAHDQCLTWCKWQVCCLVSQDIGLVMKGRLLTATLVSQKKTRTWQARKGYRVGSLLLPSDPLSSTLTEAIWVQRPDTAWTNYLQDKNSYAAVVFYIIYKLAFLTSNAKVLSISKKFSCKTSPLLGNHSNLTAAISRSDLE